MKAASVKKFVSRIQYNSPVILSFALLSCAAVVLGIVTNDVSTHSFFSVYKSPPGHVLTYVRLFSHVLGHANFDHYLSNFLLILIIGPLLEEKYGSRNMLFMILATALITGLLNIAFFNSALLGASGVVFMLILLSSFTNLEKGRVPVTLILVVIVFIGREVRDGILIQDNISRITHIFGGLFGALLGFVLNKDKLDISWLKKRKKGKDAEPGAAGETTEAADAGVGATG